VALEVTITGTQLGPWRGLPPTGRAVMFPLCGVFTFDDEGKAPWCAHLLKDAGEIG